MFRVYRKLDTGQVVGLAKQTMFNIQRETCFFLKGVMQQRKIAVLESIPFQALSYKGGALISICMSKTLILRILGCHLLGSTTAIMLPSIPTYGGTCLFIDLHIQRIVFASEETTVTQQISQRPIKCHRDQEELRPSTGPIMVKVRYSNQQSLNSRHNLC